MYEDLTNHHLHKVSFSEILTELTILKTGVSDTDNEKLDLENVTSNLVMKGLLPVVNRAFTVIQNDHDYIIVEGDRSLTRIK